ncbi:MAG: hypothetical protein QXM43_00120 [Desulfurococcaceae archaeon]
MILLLLTLFTLYLPYHGGVELAYAYVTLIAKAHNMQDSTTRYHLKTTHVKLSNILRNVDDAT